MKNLLVLAVALGLIGSGLAGCAPRHPHCDGRNHKEWAGHKECAGHCECGKGCTCSHCASGCFGRTSDQPACGESKKGCCCGEGGAKAQSCSDAH